MRHSFSVRKENTMVRKNITLDVSRSGVQGTIFVSQGDTNSRTVVIGLVNNGAGITLDETMTAFAMGRIDENDFTTACKIENNRVVFELKSAHTQSVGDFEVNIRLQQGDKILYSPRIKIVVSSSLNNEGVVIDESEYTDFSQAIAKMQEYQKRNIASVIVSEAVVDGKAAQRVEISFVGEDVEPIAFTVFNGANGEKGEQGPQGERGVQGLKGDKGENALINGKKCIDIVSGDNISIQQQNGNLIINSDCYSKLEADSNFVNKMTFLEEFEKKQNTFNIGFGLKLQDDTLSLDIPYATDNTQYGGEEQ